MVWDKVHPCFIDSACFRRCCSAEQRPDSYTLIEWVWRMCTSCIALQARQIAYGECGELRTSLVSSKCPLSQTCQGSTPPVVPAQVHSLPRPAYHHLVAHYSLRTACAVLAVTRLQFSHHFALQTYGRFPQRTHTVKAAMTDPEPTSWPYQSPAAVHTAVRSDVRRQATSRQFAAGTCRCASTCDQAAPAADCGQCLVLQCNGGCGCSDMHLVAPSGLIFDTDSECCRASEMWVLQLQRLPRCTLVGGSHWTCQVSRSSRQMRRPDWHLQHVDSHPIAQQMAAWVVLHRQRCIQQHLELDCKKETRACRLLCRPRCCCRLAALLLASRCSCDILMPAGSSTVQTQSMPWRTHTGSQMPSRACRWAAWTHVCLQVRFQDCIACDVSLS